MKRFIFCLLLGVGFMVVAQAQTGSGFNFVVEEEEEEVQTSEETVTPEVEEKSVVTAETVPTSSETQTEVSTSSTEETVQEEEEDSEEEKDDDQFVFIGLTDVKSTLASIRAVSYCSAAFVLVNGTKKDVQEVSGTIGIGDQTKKFKFSNVAPNASLGWPIQMVGNACESITSGMPNVDIKNCKVKGMSDKKCRSKLRYIPLGAF